MKETQALGGQTAVVTGASAGIGFACARMLVQDGASVVMVGRREGALDEARLELLRGAPDARIDVVAGDACDRRTVEEALGRAYALSDRLDILVPTVGGGAFRPLKVQDETTFRREFELNVISAFLMIRYGAPLMNAGGSIVCISAVPVIQPFTGLSTYLASKAALERLVSAAADELGGAGIRVNSVRPGLTLTEATTAFFADSGLLERFSSRIPLRRAGKPEDIARLVRFLAGPESAWITGQNISADGGQSQRQVPDLLAEQFGDP